MLYSRNDVPFYIHQVVNTTMVGTVLSGLSHVGGADCKEEFIVGLIRGLGGNLNLSTRAKFAKMLWEWAGERPPDKTNPLNCCYEKGSLCTYVFEDAVDGQDMVPTPSILATADTVKVWLNNSEPFILVGPQGCGKSLLIEHLVAESKSSITTLHCNAATTAMHVIQKIEQACALFSRCVGCVTAVTTNVSLVWSLGGRRIKMDSSIYSPHIEMDS